MPPLSPPTVFPTSEDIIDCMKDTGFFNELNEGVDMGDDFDSVMNILNDTVGVDLSWNSTELENLGPPPPNLNANLSLTCFPIPSLPKPKTSTFEFVAVGLLLTLISVFGLVGNIVAIVVLSRPAMKGSFSSLLIGKK